MASFGGFYKGEKKKPKKGQGGKNSQASSFALNLPEVISKRKKEK